MNGVSNTESRKFVRARTVRNWRSERDIERRILQALEEELLDGIESTDKAKATSVH